MALAHRHSIKSVVVSGERADVDIEVTDEYKKRLPEICEGYANSDIFNCDETGLFFRALPDKTLSAKRQSSKGGKRSRERITVLFCCSATGEKLKPLVIGKAVSPRCFKNIKVESLPVTWEANRKAWMTSALFTKCLTQTNRLYRRPTSNMMYAYMETDS